MKSTRLLIAPALAAALMTVSCQRADNVSSADDAVIHNFDVQEVIKSASRSYSVTFPDASDSCYLTVYTSVQWPVKFGDYDLTALQDTLLSRMYNTHNSGNDVDKAIAGFINDSNIFDDPSISCTPIDSIVNERQSNFYIVWVAKLLELTERMATYQLSSSSYLGGAHPYTGTTPFTYDLKRGCVLTLDNVFKPGTNDKLLGMIKSELASQLGLSNPASLAKADIFVDNLFVSPLIYISASGGGVVFHYNPYEIAPYSRGPIDVELAAFELTPYLTASADSLLNQ